MKKLLLLFTCAFMLNACNSVKTVNTDPKARYNLAAETVASVMRTLKHLRETKVIKNDNDWKRIKIVTKSTMDAFKDWGDAVKINKKVPDIEKLAMDGLKALQEINLSYE